jgi:hypothetical protein
MILWRHFYETGGSEDKYVDSVLSSSGQSIKDFYRLTESTVEQFGLVSFASTHEALPLWAYYADNFAGICLEFSTQHLSMGDFWNEKFRKVIYVRKSAPPIGFNDLGPTRLEEALISRLCRKRIEWSHENEWRFVTGGVGRKHYLEDALQCVYLGPRIEKENADEICNILKTKTSNCNAGLCAWLRPEIRNATNRYTFGRMRESWRWVF